MLQRLLKSKFAPGLLTVAALVGLGAAGVLAMSPHHTPSLATTVRPSLTSRTTPTPTASVAPSPEATTTDQPAVAGAATVAPKPAATPTSKPAAVSATPAPTPATYVTLKVTDPAGTSTYSVRYNPGADACSILSEAQAEGKISSLTIYDSADYKAHHGNSAYLFALNGYENEWTYDAKDSAGHALPPYGCSFASLTAGDSVTWSYGG